MSANLKICVPEATENYIQNPALRYDTTGWNAFGCTITRTLDQARFGIASLQVVTNGSVIREGCYYRVNTLAGISEPITVSAYVRGGGRVHIRLIDNPNGKEWVSTACTLRSDRWQRISVSGFSTGSSDMRLYVETDGSVAKAITFYVDGAQMERKSYATTYCDGDQDGCRWNLVNHSSNSTRSGATRAGGKWVPLAGPCRWNDDIYVTVVGGMGMPPLTNNSQSWALNAGSFYQSTKVLDRVVTLSFNVKKKNLKLRGKPDISPLHNLRQELIELIKPDLTAGGEAFLFSYQEGDRELFIRLRYEAGLEGEWDLRNPWVNSFPIRFVANDPFFEEDSQEVRGLNFVQTFPPNEYGYMRVNGQWKRWMYDGTGGANLNGPINMIAEGPKGDIYAVGQFTTGDGITLNRIGRWDGTRWNSVGTGANNEIIAIAIAPNGYVYVTGNFTSIGGVAANYVAYWDGNIWHAMGSGLNGTGYAICVAQNNQIYTGGAFTTAGGITVNYIARWDGLQWRTVGSPTGMDDVVFSIVDVGDGKRLCVGGLFTRYSCVGFIDITTNLISKVGNGLNPECTYLTVSRGSIYAVGPFTASGSVSVKYIAKWNGTSWIQVGNGSIYSIFTLTHSPKGSIIFAGRAYAVYQSFNNVSIQGLIEFDKGTFMPVDIKTAASGSSAVIIGNGLFISSKENIYIGQGATVGVNVYSSSINTIQNNCTHESNPIIYISGPGILRWLENQTTDKRIGFNLPILNGEEIEIDFGKSKITSTIRGDLSYAMISADTMNSFTLLPGENKIAAFMTDDVNGKMQIRWTPQHWSADASPTPESLSV